MPLAKFHWFPSLAMWYVLLKLEWFTGETFSKISLKSTSQCSVLDKLGPYEMDFSKISQISELILWIQPKIHENKVFDDADPKILAKFNCLRSESCDFLWIHGFLWKNYIKIH